MGALLLESFAIGDLFFAEDQQGVMHLRHLNMFRGPPSSVPKGEELHKQITEVQAVGTRHEDAYNAVCQKLDAMVNDEALRTEEGDGSHLAELKRLLETLDKSLFPADVRVAAEAQLTKMASRKVQAWREALEALIGIIDNDAMSAIIDQKKKMLRAKGYTSLLCSGLYKSSESEPKTRGSTLSDFCFESGISDYLRAHPEITKGIFSNYSRAFADALNAAFIKDALEKGLLIGGQLVGFNAQIPHGDEQTGNPHPEMGVDGMVVVSPEGAKAVNLVDPDYAAFVKRMDLSASHAGGSGHGGHARRGSMHRKSSVEIRERLEKQLDAKRHRGAAAHKASLRSGFPRGD